MKQLTNLEVQEVSMVDAGANPEAQVVLFKRKEEPELKNKMIIEQVSKTVEQPVDEQVSEPTEKSAPVEMPEPDATTVEKTEFAQLTDTVTKLAARLEETIAKAEDKEWLAKAAKYEILGEDSAKLAQLLKATSKASPELHETAVKALDTALAALQKAGTFEEIGKTGAGGAPTIEKIATEIRKQHPELTRRQALDRAFQEHPELQF